MRLFTSLTIALLPVAMALPTADTTKDIISRQSLEDITDQYLFTIELPVFIGYRTALSPPTLIWESNGCSLSPDNPLGFNYLPACQRHDFGYRNSQEQKRFNQTRRLRIDDNFHKDLSYQCTFERLSGLCEGLATVYYRAVRAFGGGEATPGRRGDAEIEAYRKAVEEYEALFKEAQAAGELPELESN